MKKNPERLSLNESYDFDVFIDTENGRFHGNLVLTPAKITLTISGEQYGNRMYEITSAYIDTLICSDMPGSGNTFFLIGLCIVRSGASLLDYGVSTYFTVEYEVEHVIYCRGHLYHNTVFTGIAIHAKAISQWVGNTFKQEEIVHTYYETGGLPDRSALIEFSSDITDYGAIGIKYNASTNYSLSEFTAGIQFPPSLFLTFQSPKAPQQIISNYYSAYSLLSFLIGDELDIDQITLDYNYPSFSMSSTLYYPTVSIPKRLRHDIIMFPLGLNERYITLDLPALPLRIFGIYFGADQTIQDCICKYIKYRRMINREERFLGYYRLLERLCYIQNNYLDEQLLKDVIKRAKPCLNRIFKNKKNVRSFLQRIPWLNTLKYNTAKGFKEVLSTIPNDYICNWEFGINDIDSIVKLRNDISHGNDYHLSEIDIEKRVKFIEILLVLQIFSKLQIQLADSVKIIPRIHGYHLVHPPKVTILTE